MSSINVNPIISSFTSNFFITIIWYIKSLQITYIVKDILADPNGDLFSKIVNKKDKVDWPLYGDGATATLIEKGDYGEAVFMLNTDGSGEDAVKIHAGMRYKITQDSLIEQVQEEGNVRNELEVFMDGMDVFNFAIRVVPRSVKTLAKECGLEVEDIDYLVYALT